MQVLGRVVWARQFVRDCYGAGIDFAARLGKVPSPIADPSNNAVGAVGQSKHLLPAI